MKIVKAITFVALMSILYVTNSLSQSAEPKTVTMKRYMVERTFPNKLIVPINSQGSKMCF